MAGIQRQENIFEAFREEHLLLDVPMSCINFVDFATLAAIGTRNLNSCSVVTITSEKGAILAHISPRSPSASPSDPFAGDNNARMMMQQIRVLYDQCAAEGYFSTHLSSSHVICAVFGDELALPDQVAIMQNALGDMGLQFATHVYGVPIDRTVRAHGTVVVVSNGEQGRPPSIYVENRPVTDPSITLSDVELEEVIKLKKAAAYAHDIGDASLAYSVEGHVQAAATFTESSAYYLGDHELMALDSQGAVVDTRTQYDPSSQPLSLQDTSSSQPSQSDPPYAHQATRAAIPEASGMANSTALAGEAIGTEYMQSQGVYNQKAIETTATDDPHAWSIEGPSSTLTTSTTSSNNWHEVQVHVEPHTFSSHEYVFYDSRNRRVSTKKGDWRKGTYHGQPVSKYKRGSRTYYTRQKIL